jgi:hypothetical protein
MNALLRFGGLSLFAMTLILGVGCTKRPAETPDDDQSTKTVEDPWPRLISGFRKETDAQACRRLLSQLSSDIALSGKTDFFPESLSPATEAILKQQLNFTESQLADIRAANFTALDAQYLAQCFYLRDVARSLDLEGLDSQAKAEAAFAWVCRQVVLAPATRLAQSGSLQALPPFPATFCLRRGSGSGLERAYVFLGVIQQLGLDGFLLGPPAASERPWNHVPLGSRTDLPKGPFWAVGVRIGNQLRIYDPWRGEAFPASLAELKAKPDLLKPWFDDKAKPWDGSIELIQEAVPILAYPQNAFAPRLKRLEQELRSLGGVKLSVEAGSFLASFQKETQLPQVKFWNAPQDPYCLLQVLNGFLPRDEGGNATDISLYGSYLYGSLPADLIQMLRTRQIPIQYSGPLAPFLPTAKDPTGLPEAIERLADIALTEFRNSFLVSPLPRELLQRGQFFEVGPQLTKTRERYVQAENRLRSDKGREQEMSDWCEKARDYYRALSVARSKNDPVEQASAVQRLESHWRSGNIVISAVIDLLTVETCLAEATYLLAISTHEQAERSFARYSRIKGEDKPAVTIQKARVSAYNACEESVGWWDKYKPYAEAQRTRFPGRADQALQLAERMAKLAKDLKP